MKYSFIILTVLILFLGACNKPEIITPGSSNGSSTNTTNPTGTTVGHSGQPTGDTTRKILIDASRDGGVWWYPQSGASGFVETDYHQGQKLANYLRNLNYQVDEIGRGTLITNDLLSRYSKVIRAHGAGYYTADELAAYESFLNRPSSLLLLQDHLTYFPNDQLSARLGLAFEGAHAGPVTQWLAHPVTAGVTSFPFNMGSVIRNADPSRITVLGFLAPSGNNGGPARGAMGIVHHPTCRIYFIGDVNGIETVQEPFTANLVKWLF